MDELTKKAISKTDKSLIRATSIPLYNKILKLSDFYNLNTNLSNNRGEKFKMNINGKPKNIDEVVEMLSMADPRNIGEVINSPRETNIKYKTGDQVTLKTVLPYFIRKQTSNYLNRILETTSKKLSKLSNEDLSETTFNERRQHPRMEYRNT